MASTSSSASQSAQPSPASPPASDAASVSSDPEALAELTGRAMYAGDAASQSLGMRLLHVGPGEARMEMTIRPDMLNGHQTCHGGFIFALADSTFAFACNSRNQVTVASGCTIDSLSPGYAGEVLLAHGVAQRSEERRVGKGCVST